MKSEKEQIRAYLDKTNETLLFKAMRNHEIKTRLA
jgi:hypothetical protein